MNRRAVGLFSGLVGTVFLAAACDRAADETRDPGAEALSPAAADELAIEVEAAMRDYRLTMDGVRAYVRAATDLTRLLDDNPELEDRLDELDEVDMTTMNDVIRAYESVPEVTRVIRNAGLTTHDFVMVMATLASVHAYVAMRDAGFPVTEGFEGVSEHNVEFYEQNREELEGLIEYL